MSTPRRSLAADLVVRRERVADVGFVLRNVTSTPMDPGGAPSSQGPDQAPVIDGAVIAERRRAGVMS
ncbi:hypothetical protein [Nocardia sp. Marseille-Q1738]